MKKNLRNTGPLMSWFQKSKPTPKLIDEQLGEAVADGRRKDVIKLLKDLRKLANQQAKAVESVTVMERMVEAIVPMIGAAASKHQSQPSKDWYYISLYVFAFACRYLGQCLLVNPEIFAMVVPDAKYPKVLRRSGAHPLNEVLDGLSERIKESADLNGLENEPLVQIIPPLAKHFGQDVYKHKIFQLVASKPISRKANWVIFQGMFTACTLQGYDDCKLSEVASHNKALSEEIFKVLIDRTCVPVTDLIKIIQQYTVEEVNQRSASEPTSSPVEAITSRVSASSF